SSSSTSSTRGRGTTVYGFAGRGRSSSDRSRHTRTRSSTGWKGGAHELEYEPMAAHASANRRVARQQDSSPSRDRHRGRRKNPRRVTRSERDIRGNDRVLEGRGYRAR